MAIDHLEELLKGVDDATRRDVARTDLAEGDAAGEPLARRAVAAP